MAVSLCATLAAVYLIVEADNENDHDLTESYRLKAMGAGAVTAMLGALALLLSTTQAPLLWQGMLAHGIPIVIMTMLIGLATAYSLFARHYRAARILIILESAFLLGSWGVSQLPYLIPPDVTIDNAANAPEVIATLLIATGIGMALLLPSLYYLFFVFKLSYSRSAVKEQQSVQRK
jgi:cytochrome d ubiquinol oxidase subunit II